MGYLLVTWLEKWNITAMKAILKFDLSDPDDRLEHLRAVNADNMAFAIWEIVYNLRKSMEWEFESAQEPLNHDTLDKVFERINNILEGHSIKIDDLVE